MAFSGEIALGGPTVKGFAPLLDKLGVIKNQLLIFVVISAIIISIIAAPLSYSATTWKAVSGVGLHVLTAFMLIGFGIFYARAFLVSPSNRQEEEFSRTVQQAAVRHEQDV